MAEMSGDKSSDMELKNDSGVGNSSSDGSEEAMSPERLEFLWALLKYPCILLALVKYFFLNKCLLANLEKQKNGVRDDVGRIQMPDIAQFEGLAEFCDRYHTTDSALDLVNVIQLQIKDRLAIQAGQGIKNEMEKIRACLDIDLKKNTDCRKYVEMAIANYTQRTGSRNDIEHLDKLVEYMREKFILDQELINKALRNAENLAEPIQESLVHGEFKDKGITAVHLRVLRRNFRLSSENIVVLRGDWRKILNNAKKRELKSEKKRKLEEKKEEEEVQKKFSHIYHFIFILFFILTLS